MEIRAAKAQDIEAWMALVEKVRNAFPGLETAAAMEEHRATVLGFMEEGSAVCAVEAGSMAGVLLFSVERSDLCFLAVDPDLRRRHIARKMVEFVLPHMEAGRDLSLITYREDDPRGQAARAFYRSLGFSEGRLLEEFGHPAQEFVLKAAAGKN